LLRELHHHLRSDNLQLTGPPIRLAEVVTMADFLSARGILPLKEGAPSPEAVIAEMRGRPEGMQQYWIDLAQKAEAKCLEQQETIEVLEYTVALFMHKLADARRGCNKLRSENVLLKAEIEAMKREASDRAN
jgi:hypothetical protein